MKRLTAKTSCGEVIHGEHRSKREFAKELEAEGYKVLSVKERAKRIRNNNKRNISE